MALMMLCLITAQPLCSEINGWSLAKADGIAHAFKGAELCSKFGMNSAFLQ